MVGTGSRTLVDHRAPPPCQLNTGHIFCWKKRIGVQRIPEGD